MNMSSGFSINLHGLGLTTAINLCRPESKVLWTPGLNYFGIGKFLHET